ncbi:alpha/beta fold hydrolase [Granulosicoccus antarcticus]|uniref:Carboxylesterase YbfK n=1 Tax=Granulosicoccus antarcticus IMCC3135 TaxID=1192854 RepID=A0A2Z2NT28_9GAMM|nr:alpha/beta hydrolase [Granulosicoccus antarcticus]ASJ74702.1 Carboxylesterase YbfK [Granulosicoccus antarcticus IMCC3135]
MIALFLILLGIALTWLSRPYSVDLYRFVKWRIANRRWLKQDCVESSDAQITYRLIRNPAADPDKPPLVLLHGGFGSYLDWYAQIPTLAVSRVLIMIDTRGHGRSTLGDKSLKYDLFVKDAIRVLDQLAYMQVDVVGWSDGGITGLLLARDHPERIRRLVAISVNAHADGLTEQARSALTGDQLAGSLKSRILHSLLSPEPGRWADLTQAISDLWQNDPWLLEHQMRSIVTPTLIIAGSNDDVHHRHLDNMARILPNATLQILAGIGHAVPQSAPAKVLQLISKFLDTSARQGPV